MYHTIVTYVGPTNELYIKIAAIIFILHAFVNYIRYRTCVPVKILLHSTAHS